MDSSVSLSAALCLSNADIEALIQGRMIATLSRTFINSIQSFALCPVDDASDRATVKIQAWAKFEFCRMYRDSQDLEKLSKLTIWSDEFLQDLLKERHKIFLACLRVYQLSQPIELSTDRAHSSKLGSFIKLPYLLSANKSAPVLSEAAFQKRQQQLIKLELPPHPELEALLDKLLFTQADDPNITQFASKLKTFLGWGNDDFSNKVSPDLEWIETINQLGDRSLEKGNGKKSNYQAGTDFENIVRQGLEYLGFTIDQAYKGGAGGLDLFCSKPYPLVGECKAGKKIPSGTTEELIKLGGMHLGTDRFLTAAKLIIGPGRPTPDVLRAAQEWRVSIINPMSLQKLAKLEADYPGSVNLFTLKNYLESGQVDHKIDEYVDKTLKEIKLRAHIIKLVKSFLENTGLADASVDALHGAYFGSHPPQPLQIRELHELLIELSSPLTGYLGRNKGNDWKGDRFYYLRDLTIEE